jgi:hypothetical protein
MDFICGQDQTRDSTSVEEPVFQPVLLGRGIVLVRTALEQRRQHHQVGQSEQPLFRLRAGCFRRSRDHAQMTAACEVMQVFHADARQAGHFRVRKDFLTGLDFNQGASLCHRRFRLLPTLMLPSG